MRIEHSLPPGKRVHKDHPLRAVRAMTNVIIGEMSPVPDRDVGARRLRRRS